MARKEKKYHYIYKTTNLKTGRFYVGMHSTNNLKDGYLGSGTRLRRSIRKNGKENFKLEIIEFLPDRKALKEREKELVNEDLLKDPMCMNLQPGGGGGFINETHKLKCQSAGAKAGRITLKKLHENADYKKMWGDKRKEAWNSMSPEVKKLVLENRYDWTGKKHSEETKRKIGGANKLNHSGHLNSQYGTMWITNGTENKKIKKEDKIPDDWYKGRK